MGFGGAGVNAGLRWDELALDSLLPVDEEKEEARKAAQARKMASGANTNHGQHPHPLPSGQQEDEEDGTEEGSEEEEESEPGEGSVEEEE
jgi:hypothetical protein